MTRSGTRGAGDVADGVVVGVDTHLDFHVAVALDRLGRRLGEVKVPTTARGYTELVRWAEDFGPVRCAGIEGTQGQCRTRCEVSATRRIRKIGTSQKGPIRTSPRRRSLTPSPSGQQRRLVFTPVLGRGGARAGAPGL